MNRKGEGKFPSPFYLSGMSGTVEDILGKYNEPIAQLGYELRDFLLQHLEGIQEQPDISGNVIGYGYGPGYRDNICTIIPSKKGMKLGFYKGSELPDPERLLTGTGKVHKYVPVVSAADIQILALKKLLEEATSAYKKRIK